MTWRVLYLDTNHISDLARHASAPSSVATLRLLQDGSLQLSLTFLHFVELSAASFCSFPEVKALLDNVPIAWTVSTTELWDAEVAVACAQAKGLVRGPPKPFCASALGWSRGPDPARGSAGDFLEVMHENQTLREQLLSVAEDAARLSAMKTDALIVRHPELPLYRLIDEHLDDRRSKNPDYAMGLEAAAIVQRVGGREAFPSACVHQAVIRQRLLDTRQRGTSNDVLDEYHAAYAPYCVATVLDRRTLSRVRSAKLDVKYRVTSRLGDIPSLLARVLDQTSNPLPTAD